jgi:hypothetical protein
VRTLLDLAGTRVDDGPDRGFRLELERRLVTAHPPGRLVALPSTPRRARRPGVVSGAVAATAAAVLVGALTGVYGRGIDDRTLALAVAVDTVVQLPDGTTVTGAQGLSLPDGAVVRTGPNGHCAAGDVELGPGLEALVDAGHLRLRTVAPADAATDAVTVVDPVARDASSVTTLTRPTSPSGPVDLRTTTSSLAPAVPATR